jgi:multiple sugar transport system ATP-binding protein
VVGDGVHVVVDGGGEAVHFPAPRAQRDRVAAYDGKPVILGLRPETIGAAGRDDGADETFGVVREVEVVEPTGPDTLLIFTLGGVEATARVRPKDERPVGASCRFEVDMAKAKIFDPASGKRI